PHGDPALHRGDGGEREHTGAVPGRVDADRRRPRHAVDPDVALLGERHPDILEAHVLGVRDAADGEAAAGGGDAAAVGELDLDAVTDAPHGGGAGAGQDVHPAAAEDGLDELGGVLVLTREHAVAAGDEGDRHPQAVVGAGELGAGDAGADDDEVLG